MDAPLIRLMSLFDILPSHVCVLLCLGEDWSIKSCNTAFTQLVQRLGHTSRPEGLSLRELLSRYALTELPPGHGDGQLEFLLESSPWRMAWQDTEAGLRCVVLRDGRERADMEAVENFSQELYAIMDSMHDGLWVIDGQGITLHVNKALKRIAGIEPEEMIGKSVSVPLTEGKFSAAVTLEALEQKKIVTRFDDYPNGSRCLNTSTPIFDARGQVWRVVACIRDMSELEFMQRDLADAERRHYLHDDGDELYHDSENRLIATSAMMRRCMSELERAARAPSGILIQGETGTGKTYAASWIHQRSSRSRGPFIAVNCAAIPPSLIESELFGYDRGAFTGANRTGRKGYFELAHTGTLLLDEIGELPLNMQAKILHVLDGQAFRKIGSEKEVRVDVRVIAATNRSLAQLVSEGSFRADLYYRLRVLCIRMPPLREHPQDIVPLMMFFLGKACSRYSVSKSFSPKVIECFCRHAWPGNVRELRAAVEFAATMTEGNLITLRDLPSWLMEDAGMEGQHDEGTFTAPHTDSDSSHGEASAPAGSFRDAVADLERSLISRALAETGSTYKAAARLGISQSTVVRKAQQLGITVQERRGTDQKKAGSPKTAGSL